MHLVWGPAWRCACGRNGQFTEAAQLHATEAGYTAAVARPDLKSPEALAAYRRELGGVARGWRYSGLACIALGSAALWASAQGSPTRLAGLGVMLTGWAFSVVGIVKRTRYHRARMTEPQSPTQADATTEP